VIENNPDIVETLRETEDILYIEGDATQDEEGRPVLYREPGRNVVLSCSDQLFVLGTVDQVKHLKTLLETEE
jgi:hypothetical protein